MKSPETSWHFILKDYIVKLTALISYFRPQMKLILYNFNWNRLPWKGLLVDVLVFHCELVTPEETPSAVVVALCKSQNIKGQIKRASTSSQWRAFKSRNFERIFFRKSSHYSQGNQCWTQPDSKHWEKHAGISSATELRTNAKGWKQRYKIRLDLVGRLHLPLRLCNISQRRTHQRCYGLQYGLSAQGTRQVYNWAEVFT